MPFNILMYIIYDIDLEWSNIVCTVGCEENNHWHSRSNNTVSITKQYLMYLWTFIIIFTYTQQNFHQLNKVDCQFISSSPDIPSVNRSLCCAWIFLTGHFIITKNTLKVLCCHVVVLSHDLPNGHILSFRCWTYNYVSIVSCTHKQLTVCLETLQPRLWRKRC